MDKYSQITVLSILLVNIYCGTANIQYQYLLCPISNKIYFVSLRRVRASCQL